MRGVMWFRADLRVEDNLALFMASQECRDGLAAIFYIPVKTWKSHHMSGCQVNLILDQLGTIHPQLEKLNIPLITVKVETFDDCVKHLDEFMDKHQIEAVYLNRQYELNERLRDDKLEHLVKSKDRKFAAYDDTVLCPPGKIFTPKGVPYTVFTPFKKAFTSWYSRHGRMHPVKLPEKQVEVFVKATTIPQSVPGFKSEIERALWPAGEKQALKRLDNFIKGGLLDYDTNRDYPALEGTSRLSPYLAIGAISPRMCIHKVISSEEVQSKSSVDAWVSELVWREFYQHIAYHFPEVCKGSAFNKKYNKIVWDHDKKLIKAWMEGRTGFPLVDAAMRQLRQTGWMHNRLRMLVAMFFTKLMYQDWRIGEQFFMEHLIDGSFAANNGGWQWSASTGTDAAPFFRIFNPVRQSENFDPEGLFIKRYCPELKSLSAEEIHDPWARALTKMSKIDYPHPIIDYKSSRAKTLENFKALN